MDLNDYAQELIKARELRERIARRLRLLRLARGWTLEQVADKTGLAVTYLESLEKACVVLLGDVPRITRIYGVLLDDLSSEDEWALVRVVGTKL